MALRRRTRVFRTVGWLVCQVIEIPNIDDVDQAALDAHIAALAERDAEGACPRPSRDLNAAPWLDLRLTFGSPLGPTTRRTPPAEDVPASPAALGALACAH
jgi:hypothetical protein